jgi:hypothetical protein
VRRQHASEWVTGDQRELVRSIGFRLQHAGLAGTHHAHLADPVGPVAGVGAQDDFIPHGEGRQEGELAIPMAGQHRVARSAG